MPDWEQFRQDVFRFPNQFLGLLTSDINWVKRILEQFPSGATWYALRETRRMQLTPSNGRQATHRTKLMWLRPIVWCGRVQMLFCHCVKEDCTFLPYFDDVVKICMFDRQHELFCPDSLRNSSISDDRHAISWVCKAGGHSAKSHCACSDSLQNHCCTAQMCTFTSCAATVLKRILVNLRRNGWIPFMRNVYCCLVSCSHLWVLGINCGV